MRIGFKPGNANLPIGLVQAANREIGVPRDCAEKNRTLENHKGAAPELFQINCD
jgi:hypothetical protein